MRSAEEELIIGLRQEAAARRRQVVGANPYLTTVLTRLSPTLANAPSQPDHKGKPQSKSFFAANWPWLVGGSAVAGSLFLIVRAVAHRGRKS
jgi:hypothetical protein